ncbi:unnamed protein product [Agarophyton chilense]
MRPKRRPDWAHLVCVLLHVVVATSHVLVSRHALRVVAPAALAAFQLATIATSLWFWSLFGLFRLRVVPTLSALSLAVPHALLTLSHFVLLARASLVVYVGVRLVPVAFGRFNILALVCGSLLVAFSVGNRSVAAAAFVYVAAARAVAHVAKRSFNSVLGTDLQIALFTKSLSALLLLVPAVYTTDAQVIDLLQAHRMSAMVVCASALMAFAHFVSIRALISRCSQRVSDVTLVCSLIPLLPVFVMEDTFADANCLLLAVCMFVLALDAVARRERARGIRIAPVGSTQQHTSSSSMQALALTEIV